MLTGRKKRDGDIIEKLIKKADEARRTGMELSKIAAKQARIRGKILKESSAKKIFESIKAAKRMTTSREEDLRMLERLGKLKKSGLITEKEFQTKKKEILKRI